MRNLTIGAASLESAQGFFDALNDFGPSLVRTEDGNYEVWITLDTSNRRVLEALNALEKHVTERAAGPARLELDGRSYLLDGADAEPAPDAA